jgi:hypothetical protein
MSNDAQLKVSIDMESLKAEVDKAGDYISSRLQASVSSVLSDKTLGNGLAPMANPEGKGEMLSVLEKILHAVEGTNTGMAKTLEENAATKRDNRTRTDRKLDRGGTEGGGGIAHALKQGSFSGMFSSAAGFSHGQSSLLGGISAIGREGGILGRQIGQMSSEAGGMTGLLTGKAGAAAYGDLAESLVDKIPGMGGVASAIGSINAVNKAQDAEGLKRYNAWRRGGDQALSEAEMYNGAESMDWRTRSMMTNDQRFDASRKTMKAFGDSDARNTMMFGQRFDMMDEGIGLMGAVKRAGGNVGEAAQLNILGLAIGMAAASGLEQGRWGEAMAAMTRMVSSIQHGKIDADRIANTQAYINNLGANYQGDTAAHRSMEKSISEVHSGAHGGIEGVLALRRQMAQAGSYAGARTQRALDMQEGNADVHSLDWWLERPYIKAAIASGDEREAMSAAGTAVMNGSSMSELQWMDLIKAQRRGRSTSDVVPSSAVDSVKREIATGARFGGLSDPLSRAAEASRTYNADTIFQGDDWFGRSSRSTSREVGAASPAPSSPASGSFMTSPTSMLDNRNAVVNSARLSDGVLAGPTSAQSRAASQESRYATSSLADYAVNSDEEAESQWSEGNAGHGLYQAREKDQNGKPFGSGKTSVHGSRDIYMPPGSVVYAPVAGTWVRNATIGGTTYNAGGFGELKGDNGILYRFLHIAEFSSVLRPGVAVSAGQKIGTTMKTKVGNSKSHLHFEAWSGEYKKSKMVDPFQGADGKIDRKLVNNLYTGSDSSGTSDGSGSGSSSGGGGVQEDGPVTTPRQSAPAQRVEVHVKVSDNRITTSVRQAASARQTRHGKGVG